MRRRNPVKSAQEQFISCLCTVEESVGDFVYIDGDMIGSQYVVRKCNCFDEDKMPVIGVVIKKTSDTDCVVQCSGLVKGIFSDLSAGKTYKIHGDGISELRPEPAEDGYSLVQFIGTAFSNNILMLSIDFDLKKAVSY